jgi:hypothetical protein
MFELILTITLFSVVMMPFVLHHYLPIWSRRTSARQVASRMGFTFEGDGDPFTAQPDFPRRQMRLLWTSQGDKYRNVLRGTTSLGEVMLFDYWCTLDSENSSSYNTTVVAFHLPDRALPPFVLEREDGTTRLLTRIGYQDIDFPSHPRFSDHYLLRTANGGLVKDLVNPAGEHDIRALFTPAVLDLWETAGIAKGWSANGAEHWLLLFRPEASPDQLSALLREAETLAEAFRTEGNSR